MRVGVWGGGGGGGRGGKEWKVKEATRRGE